MLKNSQLTSQINSHLTEKQAIQQKYFNRRNFCTALSMLLITACAPEQKPKSIVKKTPRMEYFDLPISTAAQENLARQMIKDGFFLGAKSYLRIFKEEKTLEIWTVQENGKYGLFRRLPICTFSGTLGPKYREGDKQAPEGFYEIHRRQLNPNSQYHLAMNIGYPNQFDRAHGYTGGKIMIHGDCVSSGCYAMDDLQIEMIYAIVSSSLQRGQVFVPVHIFPFRMDAMTMRNRVAASPYADFWQQLQPAYDYFERIKVPPRIEISGNRYVVLPHLQNAV